MRIHTSICDLFNIEHPVIQGGMAWIAGGRLAAAVSEAGGMGTIGCGNAPADWLKQQIDIARGITSRNFAVNLVMTSPYLQENLELIVREKIPVVATGGGNPGPYMAGLKEAGIKVMPVVASVALAKRLERLGADAFVVEGVESGGHVGEMTTICIVPMVADAVKVPIVAAGGIADGRGLVAALALGAKGAQMGTRFICAQETDVHPNYQEKVIKTRDRSTVVCGETTGHPVRAIQNPFTHEYLKAEKSGADADTLQKMGIGRYPLAAVEGDMINGSILCGQVVGLVKQVQPAAQIVEEVISEAVVWLQKAGGLLC
ncbi:MAG TPA: nitronate monooxygenase [Syntrophomonadaceae bacterium]|nr:nitronate monooxygenase [Syntrophomonadaceae bacterium]